MRTNTYLALLALASLAGASGCAESGPEAALGTKGAPIEIVVDGNPSCADLGYGDYELKIEPGPFDGSFAFDPFFSVELSSADGVSFDWNSELGVDAVIVKGGPTAQVWVYEDEASGGLGFTPPINDNTGLPYAISHISFCYDYEVVVSKTAETSYQRQYLWEIGKTAALESLTLAAGQAYPLGYAVTASVAGTQDSGWRVEGQIEVFNPAPVDAVVTGVYDEVDYTFYAPVDCGVTFPYVLPAGERLICTYGVDLPDGAQRTNKAWADTEGSVGPGRGTAAVDFTVAQVDAVDECITVDDSLVGALGTVCAEQAPARFEYLYGVGPYGGCGEFVVDNVASFLTGDLGLSGSASVSVPVGVPCVGGCTLTPGYWKTHSSYGPAPYDDAWALLPAGEETPFYLSGGSYYELLWVQPRGNAYYILSHAYIAAVLNVLNDADSGPVAAELSEAEAIFANYTPAQVGALRGNSALRVQILALAATLDAYNNGEIGPGHCDN